MRYFSHVETWRPASGAAAFSDETHLMQTTRRKLRLPAATGGLALVGGLALWQLGIEFEEAWMRSYEQPMLGDPSPAAALTPREPRSPGPPGEPPRSASSLTRANRRRWKAATEKRAAFSTA